MLMGEEVASERYRKATLSPPQSIKDNISSKVGNSTVSK
jgi:hypothetical protein